MIKLLNILIFIFFFTIIATGQSTSLNQLEASEKKIESFFDKIADSKNDKLNIAYNDSIKQILDTILLKDESFSYPFSSLNFLGKIVSPDNIFRILNWNLVFKNGTYEYFGYIQVLDKKKKAIKLYPLIDKSDSIEFPKHTILNNENWFGALYYKIILNKSGGNNFYTILGWDGNDDFTTKKIIDVLYFTRSGKPKFGKNIFNIENQKTKRVIFEYNNRAVLTLRFDEYLKMIVYEHLSPEKPSQTGQYKFYVPDFSYDGLEFKKGKYIYHPAIDVYDRKQSNKKKLNDLKRREKSKSF